MVEYKIDKDIPSSNYYQALEDVIYLGLPSNHGLTDDELITHTTDSITHEVIHSIIRNWYGLTASKLFDIVGYLFYNRHDLLLKTINNFNMNHLCETNKKRIYKEFIETEGFESFLKMQYINKDSLNNAKIICNTRDL